MKVLQALISLSLMGPAVSVAATPGPGAIRVTIEGKTRVVRTIGSPKDSEFYAPISKPLRSLWLDAQLTDLGDVEIRYQGNRVARWPVVSRADRLSAQVDTPTVLRQGDELLVPVRALVAIGSGYLDWDERTQTVTITPTVRRIELKQGEQGLEVQIEASAPVKVTSVPLSNPTRLAIDITPAWFRLDDPPAPAGMITAVRLGQFTKDTARIVLEPTGPIRAMGLPQSATTITAHIQSSGGTRIARSPESAAPMGTSGSTPKSSVAPALKARSRMSGRRGRGSTASRGGLVQRDPSLFTDNAGSLTGRIICIDPGHGGWKSGAAGLNGLKEGDACLGMGLQLARALREAGATVLLTRDTDTHVSLEQRWGFANQQQAELFISIHCNASPRHNTMSGTETYYCTPRSLALAQSLHQEVVRVMGGRDGGIRRRQFAVVRHTTMPSVLLEVGYIDHTGDEAKLGDPSFQEEFGNAVRDGLIRYFGG
jgi:N-acetylmuramoyl-L-alanine amidase